MKLTKDYFRGWEDAKHFVWTKVGVNRSVEEVITLMEKELRRIEEQVSK